MSLSRLIAYAFVFLICAFGPFFLLLAAGTTIQRLIFLHSAVRTEGTIVALRELYPTAKTRKSYAPIFDFRASDGLYYTVTSDTAQNPCPWKIGAKAPVLYQPGHPEKARLDSYAQLWMMQSVLGAVGGAFSVIPVMILIRRRAGN